MAEIRKEHAEAVLTVLMNSTWHVPSHQGVAAVGIMQAIVAGAPVAKPEPKKREPLKKRTPKRSRKGKAK